jgi:hypothetical protein
MMRVPKNAHGPDVPAWIADAAIMMDDPMATVKRRPRESETYEAGTKAGIPPKLMAAMMSPSMLVDMLPRSSVTGKVSMLMQDVCTRFRLHFGIANKPFIKLPSYPLAAADANIRPIPILSFRRPGSWIH